MKAVLLAFAAIVAFAAVAPAEADPDNGYTIRRPYKGRPGYSRLSKSDTIDTRKFKDPSQGPRAQGQPFDNGFFFETPRGPYGGTTPYMH
jgi:hypothetical protein